MAQPQPTVPPVGDVQRCIADGWFPDATVADLRAALKAPFTPYIPSAPAPGAPDPNAAQRAHHMAALRVLLPLYHEGAVPPEGPAHALLCELSGPLMSNMLKFLEPVPAAAAASAPPLPPPQMTERERERMCVAEGLFVVARQQQATAAHVQECCALLQALLADRTASAADASIPAATKLADAALYLVGLALHCMLAPRPKRQPTGATAANRLLEDAAVAKGLTEWVAEQKKRCATTAASQLPFGPAAPDAVGPWLAMVAFTTGCFQHACDVAAGRDGAGVDAVLDAILLPAAPAPRQERQERPEVDKPPLGASGPSLLSGASLLSAASPQAPRRAAPDVVPSYGRAWKAIARLLPDAGLLTIPRWLLGVELLRMARFVASHMLPLVKHLSERDVASYKAFPMFLASRPADAAAPVMDTFALGGGGGGGGSGSLGLVGGGSGGSAHMASSNAPRQPSYYMCDFLDLIDAALEDLPPAALDDEDDFAAELDAAALATLRATGFQADDVAGVLGSEEEPRPRIGGHPQLPRINGTLLHTVLFNIPRHLRQVLDVHRAQRQRWDPAAHRVAGAFLRVLRHMARYPAGAGYIHAAVHSPQQLDCPELQWQALLVQVRECFAQRDRSVLEQRPALPEAELPPHARAVYADDQASRFAAGVLGHVEAVGFSGVSGDVERVFTMGDMFDLLRLGVPQAVAGSLFAAIAASLRSEAAARECHRQLTELPLLRGVGVPDPVVGPGAAMPAPVPFGAREVPHGFDLREVLAHETRHTSYRVTCGVLKLLSRLLDFPVPTHAVAYARFVARDVLCGATRRTYRAAAELHHVAALCCNVLRKALSAAWDGGGAPPFDDVFATERAPSDVLGECRAVLSAATATAAAPSDPAASVAVREVLRFLTVALQCPEAQVYIVKARTEADATFFETLLLLLAVDDARIATLAARLLARFSGASARTVVKRLQMAPPAVAQSIIDAVVRHTQPSFACDAGRVDCPPSLVCLESGAGDIDELLDPAAPPSVPLRAALLDLLARGATSPVPSLTSWLCGYPAATTGHALPGATVQALAPHMALEGIVRSVNDRGFCAAFPELASKGAKVLYLLLHNKATATPGLRQLLRMRDGHDYLDCIYALTRPESAGSGSTPGTPDSDQRPEWEAGVTPSAVYRAAFAAKTLSMELFHAAARQSAEAGPAQGSMSGDLALKHLPLLVAPTAIPLSAQFQRILGGADTAQPVVLVQLLLNALDAAPPFPALPSLPGIAVPAPTLSAAQAGRALTNAFGELPAEDDVPQHPVEEMLAALRAQDGAAPAAASADASRWAAPQTAGHTDEELRGLLLPYAQANDCLRAYVMIAAFSETWAELVQLVCTAFPQALAPSQLLVGVGSLLGTLEHIRSTANFTQVLQDRLTAHIASAVLSLLQALSAKAKGPASDLLSAPAQSRRGAEEEQRGALTPDAVAVVVRALLQAQLTRAGSTGDSAVRHYLYASLLTLLRTAGARGIDVDPALFLGAGPNSVGHSDAFLVALAHDSTHGASGTAVLALTVLRTLLAHDSIAAAFVAGPDAGLQPPGASGLLRSFTAAVLAAVDGAVTSALNVPSSEEAANAPHATVAAFGVLRRLGDAYPAAAVSANVLVLLGGMRCWALCADALFNPPPSAAQRSVAAQRRQCAEEFVLGALGLMGTVVGHQRENDATAGAVAEIVRAQQPIIARLLSPAHAAASTAPERHPQDMQRQLSLIEAGASLLFGLSRTAIAPFMPELCAKLGLPSLLRPLAAFAGTTPLGSALTPALTAARLTAASTLRYSGLLLLNCVQLPPLPGDTAQHPPRPLGDHAAPVADVFASLAQYLRGAMAAHAATTVAQQPEERGAGLAVVTVLLQATQALAVLLSLELQHRTLAPATVTSLSAATAALAEACELPVGHHETTTAAGAPLLETVAAEAATRRPESTFRLHGGRRSDASLASPEDAAVRAGQRALSLLLHNFKRALDEAAN